MDACPILLGRPWLYDTNAMHDGKKNVYYFEVNGKRHSLLPLKGKNSGIKHGDLNFSNTQ